MGLLAASLEDKSMSVYVAVETRVFRKGCFGVLFEVIVYMFLCMYTFACFVPSEARRGSRGNPRDGVTGRLIWVLGTKLGSFARTAVALYC